MACCDICGAEFALRKNLLRHIVFSHHDNGPSPMQKCDQCNYKGTFTNLKFHKKNTHREVKINCSLCTEEFASTRNLKRHVDASHKELSPHSCPICYKGFTRKDSLKRHRETECYKNIGPKIIPKRQKANPSTCQFCNKQFFDLEKKFMIFGIN